MMHTIKKSSLIRLSQSACLAIITFVHSPVQAHTDGYQDFYNTKQGTSMNADSGCRLILCLAGGEATPQCMPDLTAMYYEIAAAYYGHGYIPFCHGTMGVTQESSLNSQGKHNGAYFKNENVSVWRRDNSDAGNEWYQIYTSTRTPVYTPVNGTTDTENPTFMWNATSDGGKLVKPQIPTNTTSDKTGLSTPGYLDDNQLSELNMFQSSDQRSKQSWEDSYNPYTDDAGNAASATTFAQGLKVDNLTTTRKLKIDVFADNDYRNLDPNLFDAAVIAALNPAQGNITRIIKAKNPSKPGYDNNHYDSDGSDTSSSYFHTGDKVIIQSFEPKRGDLSQYKKPQNKFGSYAQEQASNNEPGTVTFKDSKGVLRTMKLDSPDTIPTDGSSYTFKDANGKTQVVTPTIANKNGQITYKDAKGVERTVGGKTAQEAFSSSGTNAQYTVKPVSGPNGTPTDPTSRAEEHTLTMETPSGGVQSINVMDILLPPATGQ